MIALSRTGRGAVPLLLLVAGLLGAGLASTPAGAESKGVVDKTKFIEMAGGDRAVRVEVSIHKTLIRLLCAGLDEELKRVACGLESIDAVVLDVPGPDRQERVLAAIADTEKTLMRNSWERIALVREEDSEVRVLILNDENTISGLTVMVMDRDDGELVFVNVAGLIDLAAIQRIAGEWNIPGLEDLDLEDRE